MSKQLLCPECGEDGVLQMDYIEHADVTIQSDGHIKIEEAGSEDRLTEDDLDRDTLRCATCGNSYRLECTGEGEEERVYHLEKVRILKVKSE